MPTAAVILAAGTGTRFGGGKLFARVDGAPVLGHVIGAARAASLDPLIVVMTADGAAHAASLGLDSGDVVVNPDPGRGLSSSLQLGLAAAGAAQPPIDAAVVLLGDQPLVRPETIRALLAVLDSDKRAAILPHYEGRSGQNPVVLRRAAFELASETSGDRGLGPLLEARPELVREVAVAGANPDVDTAADLARVAEIAWADRVRRNREQVDRFREAPDGPDFYASVSSIFREDPDRTGDPVLDALRRHARPTDTWLDIGAGAGRYALPLARGVREVIAIDPSLSMLAALRDTMATHGIANLRVIEGRWPNDLAGTVEADVSLIAHVGYDIETIGPFLEAMERATRRTCLAVLMERSPASIAEAFWPPLHGEPRIALPALPAFVDLLVARSGAPSAEIVETSRRRWTSRDELERFVRRQTWTVPGSAKDRRMVELLDGWLEKADDGSVELTVAAPLTIGVVTWSPSDGQNPIDRPPP